MTAALINTLARQRVACQARAVGCCLMFSAQGPIALPVDILAVTAASLLGGFVNSITWSTCG
jgi:hypothetical protein